MCMIHTDEDDEILDDEHVIQAIIEKDEHDLLKSLESDKQAIDYFCRHSEGLSEKGKKMLEKMKESILSRKDTIIMGNNAAYSAFEYTVITIYNHGVLTLELLDKLAKEYEGMDVDSGGSRDLETKDGKSLKQVCIELVDPKWVPVKSDDKYYSDPEAWEWEEKYDKWNEITDERWGWR